MKAVLILPVIAALAVVFGFWLGGFDFDRRGDIAVLCYLSSLMAALLALSGALK